MKGKLQAFLPVIGVVGLFAFWSLVAWRQWVDPVLLPSPWTAAEAFWRGMRGGALGYGLNLFFLLIERRFVHWSGK